MTKDFYECQFYYNYLQTDSLVLCSVFGIKDTSAKDIYFYQSSANTVESLG